MTEPTIPPAPRQLTADQLLLNWGYSHDTPAQLKTHAEACLQHYGRRSGELVVSMGLADPEYIESLMADKPHNTLVLEYLAEKLPEVRAERQRLLALKFRLPYFADLEEKDLHEQLKLPAVRQRCAELNALLLTSLNGTPLLAFADYDALAEYAQMGRIERMNDPIQAAVPSGLVLALAAQGVLLRLTQWDTDGTGRVNSQSAMDNFWASGMARTESERLLARIMDYALLRRATDISFLPQLNGTVSVMVRVYGDLASVEFCPVLSVEATQEVTRFLLSKSRAGDGGRLREPDGGQFVYKGATQEVFIRASFIPADRFGMDQDRISVSLRILPRASGGIDLARLGLQKPVLVAIEHALRRSQGLIVLAGPTNSGKSTTIAGLVGKHIQMFGEAKKRISLEDPVERQLPGITQISVESSFAELMRHILRHDPDVVWVGEIRDGFSASACVRAATSGHLVLSTVHANDSILAFRAIGNYVAQQAQEGGGATASAFDLAESLTLLISQRLVKRLCSHCKCPSTLTDAEIEALQQYLRSDAKHVNEEDVLRQLTSQPIFQASDTGCPNCQYTGFAGEMTLSEVLPVTRDVRRLFSARTDSLDYEALVPHRGMSLFESALDRVVTGMAEPSILFI